MGLFKTADEKFDQGNEYIKRKEYDKARAAFEKAISKGAADAEVAKVMIALLNLRTNANTEGYRNASAVLGSKGDMKVEFGLFTIECSKLDIECDACYSECVAKGLPSGDAAAMKARADALFAAGMKFQTKIGPNTLIVPEVFAATKITGIDKASRLLAEGNEMMAESVAWSEPKKAAEYLQIAMNYYRQLGDGNAESAASNKIKMYAKAAMCWICGREVTGESMHFVQMPTEVSEMQSNSKKDSPLPSVASSNSIYVCRACYLAVSKRADAIAQQYHNIAMRELRDMESRLNARINAVNARIR
jgi:tetratricopeptide (TPR) repeat protein